MNLKLFFPAALLLLLFSCRGNDLYLSYLPVTDNKWHKDTVCNFDFEITDTLVAYNMYVNIRNRSEYPYQNLWLFIKSISPDSTVARDTIEFYLSDPGGKWIGRGVGETFEMPVLYRQKFRFNEKGKYRYSITHGMRDTILKGINDVGIRIEKIPSDNSNQQ